MLWRQYNLKLLCMEQTDLTGNQLILNLHLQSEIEIHLT
jgi:hypothetical protein